MRFSFLAFALVLASCSTAPPPVAPPPVRLLDHTSRIETAWPGGYAFSRDGRTLIFSAEDSGTMKAFSVPVSGGDPTSLANSADTHVLSYFPNDDRILLRTGHHLVVRERDETMQDLGDADFLGWCENGDAMISTPNRLTLFRIDGSSYQQRSVLSLPGNSFDAQGIDAVSRDCRWAAIFSDSGIYLADLIAAGVAPRRVLERGANVSYGILGFTPTSRSLNYSERRGLSSFWEAFRYEMGGGQSYPVMQTQADVMAIQFSPTGRYGIYYSGTMGGMGITDVAVVDQTSDSAIPLSGSTRDLRFSRDETKIAFRLANDGWPNDIFVSDLDGGHITRLVHAPNAH